MTLTTLRLIRRFSIPYASIACSISAQARAEEPGKTLGPIAPLSYDAAVTGVLAKPFEGAHALSDWGYGVMLSFGLRWQDLPVTGGFDLQAIRWGRASSLEDIKLGDSWATLEKSRLDQSVLFDTWLRFEPTRWRVRPYFEGFVGLKLLETKYSLALADGNGMTTAVTDHSTASNYGFGCGLDVLLARASDASGSALFVTLGLRELYGGRATFTRAPDNSSVDRTISFDVPTHSTQVLLGFSIHAQRRLPPTDPPPP